MKVFCHGKLVSSGKFDSLAVLEYSKWQKNLESNSLKDVVDATNEYFSQCFAKEKQWNLKQQQRYTSSIIEEFLCSLLYKKAVSRCFSCGTNVRCLLRLNESFVKGRDKSPSINTTKDVDVAVYYTTTINRVAFNVPIIGVETKSYMDKTMFSSVAFSVKDLEDMCPSLLYAAAPCDDAMSVEDGAKLRDMYIARENVFILRGQRRHKEGVGNPIDHEVVSSFVDAMSLQIDKIKRSEIILRYSPSKKKYTSELFV